MFSWFLVLTVLERIFLWRFTTEEREGLLLERQVSLELDQLLRFLTERLVNHLFLAVFLLLLLTEHLVL
jgi:hypothetical protein